MGLGHCEIDLGPQYIYVTDRSNAILLLWFYLFNVLESSFVLLVFDFDNHSGTFVTVCYK